MGEFCRKFYQLTETNTQLTKQYQEINKTEPIKRPAI